MIVDNIKNAHLYYCLGERFEKALRFLQENDINSMGQGRHIICPNEVHANITKYITKGKDSCMLEGHKKYADIHYIAKGTEYIGYNFIKNCILKTSYDKQKDIANYEGDSNNILMPENTFIILFPDDIHMPGIFYGTPQQILKATVKILI